MKPRTTLKRRINRTFILQAAAISLAAVISVLLAAFGLLIAGMMIFSLLLGLVAAGGPSNV